MNTYKGFDNLMGFFKITSNPVFAQFYNDIFQRNENQNLDMRGATWGDIQNVFTYEMWEQYNNVEVQATFLDLDSDPHAFGGSAEFRKFTGSIPRHKALVTVDEPDYREKLKQLYEVEAATAFLDGDVNSAVRGRLEEYFYDKLSALPNAHKNTLNYMLGQLKSNLDFELTAKNNPQGVKGLKFPSHVPTENRKTTKFWEVAADGKITYNDAVDPIAYIQQLVYDIKNDPYNGYDRVTIEMNRKSFVNLLKHPSWAKAIAYSLDNTFYKVAGNDANAIAYGNNWLLTASIDAKIEVFKAITDIDEVILSTAVTGTEYIEKMNEVAPKLVRRKMDCFDEGKMLLRPSGNIIKIIPVAPMRPDKSAISTTIFGGRGIIEYWYEPRHKVQTWRSEMTCLPVFTAPSLIYNVSFVEDNRVEGYALNGGAPVASVSTATSGKKTSAKSETL